MLRLDDKKHFSQPLIYSMWLLMSFQAGYVNVGGFFTSGSFVSHVTGTSSMIGMGIAKSNLVTLATFGTVLLAFILGAAFAGKHIGQRQEEGLAPRYTFVLSVKSFFFAMVLILSSFDDYSAIFLSIEQVKVLIIFFLSFCCGVQNSTCALSTNGFLKPTHMTGLSTDIGIFLTKIFAWKDDKEKFNEELKKNFLRMSILLSFIFGGIISAMIFSYNGHLGFLFPFISSLCFLMMGLLKDSGKDVLKSLSLKTAQGSLLLTFLATLFFGLNSYLSI